MKSWRSFALLPTLFCAAIALAQTAPEVPPASTFKGEIRRGADGHLSVDAVKAAPERAHVRAPTMRVGPQEATRTLSEAARLARDGEVIAVAPGAYADQPAVWTQDNLTIRGEGERPLMVGSAKTNAMAEGKAIWVVRGGNVRIENIEFRGARVADGNGAGIRFERGKLVVERCRFVDNEMGILTANREELSLEVIDSEFADAPQHKGPLHHLLYVGAIGRFVLTGSRFERAYRGHLVKSRARENHIRYNRLVDGDGGRASYELEFPNGGIAYVVGNVIEQAATTDNPALIAYGAEGPRWPENGLYLAHNTLINDMAGGDFLKLWNERFPAGIETWAINNLTVGYGNLYVPGQGRAEGNFAVERRELLPDASGLPLRLKPLSPLRGKVRVPGQANGVDLLPTAEFSEPVGHRAISIGSALAPGAFQ